MHEITPAGIKGVGNTPPPPTPVHISAPSTTTTRKPHSKYADLVRFIIAAEGEEWVAISPEFLSGKTPGQKQNSIQSAVTRREYKVQTTHQHEYFYVRVKSEAPVPNE
jgi:hypothetical protein